MANEDTRNETRAVAAPQQRQMMPGTYPYGQQVYGQYPYGQQPYGQYPYHHPYHHYHYHPHHHGMYGYSYTHPYYGGGMHPGYRPDQAVQEEGQQDYRLFPFMPFGYGYPRPFMPYGWFGGFGAPFFRPPFII